MEPQAGVVGGVRVSASVPCRVLLVDGHSLYRQGLQLLMASCLPECQVLALADLADLDIPGESPAGPGPSLHPTHSVDLQRPFDLVLIDLDQRRFAAAEALAEAQRRFSPAPVAVLLDRETAPQVEAILALAPQALIHKTASEAQLFDGLTRLLSSGRSGGPHRPGEPIALPQPRVGGRPLVVGGPRPALHLSHSAGQALSEAEEFWDEQSLEFGLQSLDDLRAELSARQFDVLRLMACGRTNKQISRELGLAESTVKTHVIAIFQKLQVNSRTEATLLASRLGLIASAPAGAG
jgi:DNA-binding NarL/FixJ family response regulator